MLRGALALDAALGESIARAIGKHRGSPCTLRAAREVGGGSISRSFVVEASDRRCFVKVNRREAAGLFAAEVDGLDALRRCAQVRVPAVVGHDVCGEYAYLVLEYLELQPLQRNAADAGRALAALHRCAGERYGWVSDNFLGSTPQDNREDDDWPRFFAQRRLAPQLELARRHGYRLAGAERLGARLPLLFDAYVPLPSLVHGDLWQGNAALDAAGRLVLVDPAVHYADRECDLAMAALFGGFPADFFAAYRDAWPLADGHRARRDLYQLYHVLNHLNLFGGGYLAQAQALLDRLIAPTGR